MGDPFARFSMLGGFLVFSSGVAVIWAFFEFVYPQLNF